MAALQYNLTSGVLRLACGDVGGNFNQLYSRVRAIQKKAGPFDLLFCVGDFFGDSEETWKEYRDGSAKAPIATFILGPNKEEHKKYYSNVATNPELCENITYLGRKGVYTTSNGLTIAYLSGVESSKGESSDVYFNQSDVTSLITMTNEKAGNKGVDVLLTSQWPKCVEKYAPKSDITPDSYSGSGLLSHLALILKPRYHFVGLHDHIYERPPYRNHVVLAEGSRHVTRFISLAKVANKDKKKYLYAFNITPMCHMTLSDLVSQPIDVTECPYKNVQDFVKSQPKEDISSFFFDADSHKQQERGKKRGHGEREGQIKKAPKPTGPCWFCLGSAEVEKHLVVSVGLHTYLALAKGGLTPDHVLILPITHFQSIVSCPEDVIQEISQYKDALKKCFKKKNKCTVFYERNYRTQHLQIQVVPVPIDAQLELKDAFMTCAEEESLELFEIPKYSDISQIVPAGAPYFYTELPSGDKYLHRIKGKFPLQFGREALASVSVLNMPERVDWRECKTDKQTETLLASNFKTLFKPFDFTLL